MRKKTSAIKPLLGTLTKWLVWSILIAALILIALYIAGSYRKIDEASLIVLLRLILGSSLLLGISAFYGVILDVFYALRRKNAAWLLGSLVYLFTVGLAALIMLGAAFIIGAAGGNR